MTPFKSLLYSEIRAAKKQYIIMLIFGISYAMFLWLPVIYSQDDESVKEFIETSAISLMMIPSLFVFDDSSKGRIECGWQLYSFTLPITPTQRAAVRVFRHSLSMLLSEMIMFIDIFFLCKAKDIRFKPEYFAICAFIIAMALVIMIIRDAFIEKSRTVAELKENKKKMAWIMYPLIAVIIFFVINIDDIDLNNITQTDISSGGMINVIKIFSTRSLVFWIPVVILLWVVYFYVLKAVLTSGCSVTTIRSEKDTGTASVNVINEHRSHIRGFMYKELILNKATLIFTMIIPVFCFGLTGLFALAEIVSKENPDVSGLINSCIGKYRIVFHLLSFFIASNILTNILQGDDKKQWAYFVASTPKRVKGYMLSKYEMYLAASAVFLLCSFIIEGALYVIRLSAFGEKNQIMTENLILIFFVLLLLSAIDIPLILRFGSKKGSVIKNTVMMLAATAFVVIFCSVLSDEAREAFITQARKLLFGGELHDLIKTIKHLTPFIASAAFIGSYFLSCKVYMKGMNTKEK